MARRVPPCAGTAGAARTAAAYEPHTAVRPPPERFAYSPCGTQSQESAAPPRAKIISISASYASSAGEESAAGEPFTRFPPRVARLWLATEPIQLAARASSGRSAATTAFLRKSRKSCLRRWQCSQADLDCAQLGNAPQADGLRALSQPGGKGNHQFRAARDRSPRAGLEASSSSTASRLPGATSSCSAALPRMARRSVVALAGSRSGDGRGTDSKMRMNPVQRQRLPASASRISAMVGMRSVVKQLRGCHQHARRADATLRAAAIKKRLLQWVQFSADRQPFHRLNLCSLGLQHGHQAAVHQLAVHAHRARSAFALAASFLGSRQVQVFAQHVKQALQRRRLARCTVRRSR